MKKKLKILKNISLILTLFVALILLNNVNAKDDDTFCDPKKVTEPDSVEILKRYNFKLEEIPSTNEYKLTMNKGCSENVSFEITSINESKTHSNVGNVLSCGDPIRITLDGAPDYLDEGYGLPALKVTLVSKEKVKAFFKDPNSCYWERIQVDITVSLNTGSISGTTEYDTIGLQGPSELNSIINCDENKYTKAGVDHPIVAGSFEDKFCIAKRNAGTNTYNFGNGGKYPENSTASFTCNKDISSIITGMDNSSGDNYFKNTNYLYGISTTTIPATIEFHYNPQNTVQKQISCEITCEEAVEVEYGPPVASKAGLCFEYKVRVTSRVSCNMTKAPDSSKLCENTYCTPYPNCIHGSGGNLTQAGPNDTFDACINSCDGGNYTKECSKKCYNTVYGTSENAKNVSGKGESPVAQKLYSVTAASWGQTGAYFDCNGYYYMSNNDIKWSGVNGSAGRWYCTSGWNNLSYDYRKWFYADENGFFRKEFSKGDLCTADCYWSSCSNNEYINEKVPCSLLGVDESNPYCNNGELNILAYDCAHNQKVYNELIAACEGKASCSTTTAEFTIKAEYTKAGENTYTSLEFPYDTKKDTISTSNGIVTSTKDNNSSTLFPNYPVTGEGLLGCYKNGSTNTNLYRSTWGFPGTLINLKTGEISYNYKDIKSDNICYSTDNECSGKQWYSNDDRFCVPRDAKSVNTDWWNAYYRALSNKNGISLSIDQEYVKNKCMSTVPGTIYENYTSPTVEKYNIHANTYKFGYFDWNINVDCFYAINNSPTRTVTYAGDIPKECDTGSGYDIRTVDLKNLFPDEGGADSKNATLGTGREPGFNWSNYSSFTNSKGLEINPADYISFIQEKGDAIYSGTEYLDYQFYLSPSDIRKMRKDIVSSQNYTDFATDGFFVDRFGVARYKSTKIRELNATKLPASDALLACNNMHNC